jgi:hypothetical protein
MLIVVVDLPFAKKDPASFSGIVDAISVMGISTFPFESNLLGWNHLAN